MYNTLPMYLPSKTMPISTLDTTDASRPDNGTLISFDVAKTVERTFEYLHSSTDAAFLALTLHANENVRPTIPAAHLLWRGNRLDEAALKLTQPELSAQASGQYALSEGFERVVGDNGPAYVVEMPIYVGERLSGYLTIAWEEKPSSNLNIEGGQLMVHTLGIGLETVRRYQAQQHYIEALEYVGGLSGELNVLPDVNEVMTRIVSTACTLLEVPRCAVIMTKDYDIDQVHARGLPTGFLDSFKYVELVEETSQRQQPTPRSGLSRVFGEGVGKPIPAAWQEIFEHEDIHTCIHTPLHSHNRIFGGFWLFYDHTYAPSAYDIKLVEILATQAAVALENIELNLANREHAQMLEERVAERTTELAVALDKAEDADRLKSNLLSGLSQEFRTPLAVIKAHSSTIASYYDRLPRERHLQYLWTINEEGDALTEMINSLLDMSRLEAGHRDIRSVPFQLLEVFEELMEALRARYSDRPLQVTAPSNLRLVMADPERVRQLIANLVDNAAKYSPEKSPITVSLHAWDDALEIAVQDEDYGLTPQQARRVFERFYQTNSSDYPSSRNGVGLGLSICKGLVEEMGGRIWCTSEGLNKGSKFAFTLPWANVEKIVKVG